MKKLNPLNTRSILLLAAFLCLFNSAFAQKRLVRQIKQERFHQIVDYNQRKTVALNKSFAHQRALAYSYAQMAMPDKAYDAYFELLEKYPDSIQDVDRLQFALVARQMEFYGLSDSIMLYVKSKSFSSASLFEELNQDFYNANKEKRSDYWDEMNLQENFVIKKIPQSTSQSEYALVPDGKGKAYFSQQKDARLWKKITGIQGKTYHQIILARYSDSSIIFPEVLKFNKSRTNQHVSCVDKVNGWIYVTRNVRTTNTKNEKVLEIVALRRDRKDKRKWIELPFQLNNPNFSVADLVIHPDGSKVVFTSDMPGGFGKSDLYEAVILENNENGLKIGEPINMGPAVNTALRDNFPRFSDSGDFYFSSEGHLGFGGLDIYTIDRNTKEIRNLGKPINSRFDDYSPQFHEKWGTISSNRSGGGNNDDLYFLRWFEDTKYLKEPTSDGVIVQVIDEATGITMPNVDIAVDNLDDLDNAISAKTDSTGRYFYTGIAKSAKLQATTHPCGYKYGTSQEYSVNADGKKVVTISVQKFKEGEDLGVLFDVKPIFYKSNSYELTHESTEELDRVVIVLKDNPGLMIELGAHTDSKGSDEFNQQLSEFRAKSVYNYLISKNIAPERLKFKGYGESKILNRCLNDVECSDEEHQLNRRTEYIIYGVLPCEDINTIDNRSLASNKSKSRKKGAPKLSNNSIAKSSSKKSSKESNQGGTGKPSFTKADLQQNNMTTGDADGDGIPDYLDPDSDNDRIPDAAEGRKDSDADGLPNFIDKDSDNDGIPDLVEGAVDTDKDGKGNYIDTDSDNDGIKDQDEGIEDSDNDGKPNYIDTDSDNDGISDRTEGSKDFDNDGIPNFLDQDSDADGIEDSVEGTKDSDADGKLNYLDTDSDNDGIPDKVEGTNDTDNDGKPDYIDTDSDEDGIPDRFESPANYKNYPSEAPTVDVNSPKSDATTARNNEDNDGKNNTENNPVAKKSDDNATTDNSLNSAKEVYRVQVMMSSKPVNKSYFTQKGVKEIFMYKDGGYFKYCVGKTFDLEADADTEKERLRNQGFADAFVVKFKGNKRVK